MENLDPRDGASLDPRGLTGRIYVGDHWKSLHTKYITCVPMVSEEKIFLKFFLL